MKNNNLKRLSTAVLVLLLIAVSVVVLVLILEANRDVVKDETPRISLVELALQKVESSVDTLGNSVQVLEADVEGAFDLIDENTRTINELKSRPAIKPIRRKRSEKTRLQSTQKEKLSTNIISKNGELVDTIPEILAQEDVPQVEIERAQTQDIESLVFRSKSNSPNVRKQTIPIQSDPTSPAFVGNDLPSNILEQLEPEMRAINNPTPTEFPIDRMSNSPEHLERPDTPTTVLLPIDVVINAYMLENTSSINVNTNKLREIEGTLSGILDSLSEQREWLEMLDENEDGWIGVEEIDWDEESEEDEYEDEAEPDFQDAVDEYIEDSEEDTEDVGSDSDEGGLESYLESYE